MKTITSYGTRKSLRAAAVLALLCGGCCAAPTIYAASSYSYGISQRSSSESGEKGIFYGDVHVNVKINDVDWSTVSSPTYSLVGSELETEIKNTHIYGVITEDTLTVGNLVYDIGAVNFTNMSPRAAETTKTLVSVSAYSHEGTLNSVPSDWTMSGDFKSATKTITDDYIKSGTGYTVKGKHTDTISAVSESSGGKYNSSLNYTVGTATITDIKLDFGRIEVNTWSTLPFLSVNAEDSTQDYSTDKVTIKAQNYNNIFGTTNESVSGTKTLVSITGTNAGVSGNITAETYDGDTIGTEGVTVSKDFSDSITPYGEVQTFAFGGNHTDTIKEERKNNDTYEITYTVGKKLIKSIGVHTINLSGFQNGNTFYTADAQYKLNDVEGKQGNLPKTTVNLDKLKFKNMPDYFDGTLLAFTDTSGQGSLELQLVDGGESSQSVIKQIDYTEKPEETVNGISAAGLRDVHLSVNNKTITMKSGAENDIKADRAVTKVYVGTVDINQDKRNFTNLSANGGTIDLADAEIENLTVTWADLGTNKILATAEGNQFGDNWTFQNGTTLLYSDNINPATGVTGVLNGKYNTSGGSLNLGIGLASLTFDENLPWAPGTTALDISGNTVDLSETAVDATGISFRISSDIANADKMTLLRTASTQKLNDANIRHNTAVSFTVGDVIQAEGKTETVTEGDYTDVIVSVDPTTASAADATHHSVMAASAGASAVAHAGVTSAETAGAALSAFSENDAEGDIMTFAKIGGSTTETKTGSHVKSNLWHANLGIGARKQFQNGGNFEYALYYEGGHGNYTSVDSTLTPMKSSGDLTYNGGGLFLRYESTEAFYGEIGFRGGRIGNDCETMGFDESANYFGWHAGAGKIFRVSGNRSLDVYGKFFMTRTGSMNYTGTDGTDYHLDGVTSKELRLGGRYNVRTGARDNWYAGLAYSYEFGGEATGRVGLYGVNADIRPAVTRGGTGILELGYKREAGRQSPWEFDISLKGYAGREEGFGADIGIKYMF